MRLRYNLRNAETFSFLRQSGQWEVEGGSDGEDFGRLLEVFGVSSSERDALWTVLAAILHLGDVCFIQEQVKTDTTDTVGCSAENPDSLDRAAHLLGVPFEVLDRSLRFTRFTIGSETIFKPNPPQKATDARDALAKALYEGIFGWVQIILNRGLGSMEPPETSKKADMVKVIELARGARWRCDRYIYLRTAEDYGRSIWRPGLRRQHMSSMLSFTSLVIPTSLTKLKIQEDVKQSISLWKKLLSLGGARKTTFPAAQAHAVVKLGASRPSMRQEIFMQIIKFVNGNTDAQKCWRGWVCMCLCISIFGPSVDFELYLLNFLLLHVEHPQIGPYAFFCVGTLQEEMGLEEGEMHERVRRKQIPSAEYIFSILSGQAANPFVDSD